jgi:nucleotide-binding universal stress UspA family protein
MRLRAETIARELALPPATHAHVEVRRGSAAAALAGAAERSDLVVIGTATNQLAQHVPAMSLAWRLIARLRCPLLVVRERPSAPYRQVAVAVDLSKRNRSALQWAQLIAPEARIELMHVLDVPFEGKMRYAGVKDRVIEKYRMNALLQAVDSMEQLLAYSQSDNVTSRIFDGRIASRIVDRTREVDADLVVVAPASKTAFGRWLLPSVTASVMSESTRDVLVVPEST